MKTLKNGLKKENIDSKDINIFISYSRKDCVRIALYAAEDCLYLNPKKKARAKLCIDLIKKWLSDETSVTKKELQTAARNAAVSSVTYVVSAAVAASIDSAYWAVVDASYAFGVNRESKLEEYLSYARLFAYEDLSFPYRKEAKTFNLDDNDDELNIFLDFLTDNYPTAITFKREEYFTKRFPREELKVIYQ